MADNTERDKAIADNVGNKLTGTSKEGLKPGDVLFFYHTDHSLNHQIIRFANSFFGGANEEDSNYIHTEICTGIDTQGRAIITGASGGDQNIVRATTFEEKLESGGAEKIRICRSENQHFALQTAIAARKIHSKGVTYSKMGWL